MEDGTGLTGGVRREDAEPDERVARVLRRLPARARRLAPPAEPPHARSRRLALVLGLALVLQPRRRLHLDAARLSTFCLPARADGVGRAPRSKPLPRRGVLAGVAARGR